MTTRRKLTADEQPGQQRPLPIWFIGETTLVYESHIEPVEEQDESNVTSGVFADFRTRWLFSIARIGKTIVMQRFSQEPIGALLEVLAGQTEQALVAWLHEHRVTEIEQLAPDSSR